MEHEFWEAHEETLLAVWTSSSEKPSRDFPLKKRANAALLYYARKLKSTPVPCSTQAWQRAKGANDILLNPRVEKYYIFKDGDNLFPLDYTPGFSKDFLTSRDLKDGF